VASPAIAKGGPIPPELNIYRALNPAHLQDGLPGDNHFVMKQKHEVGDGVSFGIAPLISISAMRSIDALRRRCGDEFGIAEINVAEALQPVVQDGIRVIQQDDEEWGVHREAHAILTGYQSFQGNAGRRRISELQRHLVKLARKRFYPQGSEAAIASAE
jgi:hypothetical protein